MLKTRPKGAYVRCVVGAYLSARERKCKRENRKCKTQVQWNKIIPQHPLLMSYHCNHHIHFSIPISFLHLSTLTRSSGLVSRSAAMSVVGMKRGLSVPPATSSRSQKKRKSRCFIRPWCSGFLATEIADWLSIRRIEGESNLYPSSPRNCRNQTTSFPA